MGLKLPKHNKCEMWNFMAHVEETNNQGLKREYSVTVSRADMDARYDKKLRSLSKKVRIDGFRKGKVPTQMIVKQYGASVEAEIMEEAVSGEIDNLLKTNELSPVARPDVSIKNFYGKDKEGDLTFDVSLETMPEIPEYDLSSVTVKRYVLSITDQEITDFIDDVLKDNGKKVDAEEGYAAEEGDVLTIDFTGVMNNEEFEGGSATNAEIELGEKRFIPGFEEGLIGVKKGDEKSLELTFPDPYHSDEFSGKDVTFNVTVKDVKKFVPAELNEELFNAIEVKDEAELRSQIREIIEERNKNVVRPQIKKELFDTLETICDFPVPEKMVDTELAQLKNSVKGTDEDPSDDIEKNKKLRDIAVRRIRLGLYLAHYAQKNDIQVTQQEIYRQLVDLSRQAGIPVESFINILEQRKQGFDALSGQIIEEKSVDILLEKLKIEEIELSLEEFEKIAEEDEENDDAEAKQLEHSGDDANDSGESVEKQEKSA